MGRLRERIEADLTLRSYCEPVMVAVDRLCQWIGGCKYYPLTTASATRSPTWLVE
jgi:hypothetical protein